MFRFIFIFERLGIGYVNCFDEGCFYVVLLFFEDRRFLYSCFIWSLRFFGEFVRCNSLGFMFLGSSV